MEISNNTLKRNINAEKDNYLRFDDIERIFTARDEHVRQTGKLKQQPEQDEFISQTKQTSSSKNSKPRNERPKTAAARRREAQKRAQQQKRRALTIAALLTATIAVPKLLSCAVSGSDSKTDSTIYTEAVKMEQNDCVSHNNIYGDNKIENIEIEKMPYTQEDTAAQAVVNISENEDKNTSTTRSQFEGQFDFDLNLTPDFEYSLDLFLTNWENNKERYEAVEEMTGVPAELIAAIHFRESSGNFDRRLRDGESLDGFSSWEESAVDALLNSNAKPSTIKEGDIDTYYQFAEDYNGDGYRKYHGINSPYIWSGTQHYSCGKYDRNGHYNEELSDQQLGVAVMLQALLDEGFGELIN